MHVATGVRDDVDDNQLRVHPEVVLTKDAERDLEDIYRYIAEHDSRGKADQVLNRLQQATEALTTLPDRGACANELRSVGISE